ncbi:MAG: fructan beta-fructosidase, partial [Cyclobacteriaceae bacterium]
MKKLIYCLLALHLSCSLVTTEREGFEIASIDPASPLRPQFHFSPPDNWMNDPNGMFYSKGYYHLFYQYYPDSTVWGPMHWGHARSNDLVNWDHLPIALSPDENGLIFSGSAVYDKENTSGLGKDGAVPIVAIYTYHDMAKEKSGVSGFQSQGVAYSLDEGNTWVKYDSNPVLERDDLTDFRDPKVFWHEPTSSWVMVLAVKDHVSFYGSPNLIEWTHLSDFGQGYGSHDGVWECPDLIELMTGNSSEKTWTLVVSIGTGSARGSATQYFLGDFDGEKFSTKQSPNKVRWLDQGKDNYAGVTWSNMPEVDGRKIFLGWMNNWDYAQVVPEDGWRGAMTLPRSLFVINYNGVSTVASYPVKEVELLRKRSMPIKKHLMNVAVDWTNLLEGNDVLIDLELVVTKVNRKGSWQLRLSNELGEEVTLGYKNESNEYFVDRSLSDSLSIHPTYDAIQSAKRIMRKDQFAN